MRYALLALLASCMPLTPIPPGPRSGAVVGATCGQYDHLGCVFEMRARCEGSVVVLNHWQGEADEWHYSGRCR